MLGFNPLKKAEPKKKRETYRHRSITHLISTSFRHVDTPLLLPSDVISTRSDVISTLAGLHHPPLFEPRSVSQ